MTDNLGIAFGATIENVIGGGGADTIVGNSGDERDRISPSQDDPTVQPLQCTHTGGIEIGSPIDVDVSQRFRGEIKGRSDNVVIEGDSAIREELSEAKIAEHHAIVCEVDVLWFNVSMDQALFVEIGEGF